MLCCTFFLSLSSNSATAQNFGDMPSEAAKGYGDRKFVAMMLAKVFCVQMVSMLGYDLLFQDVDIVWYKQPLEYFNGLGNDGFDIYFQVGSLACCFNICAPLPTDLATLPRMTAPTPHDTPHTRQTLDFILFDTTIALATF